MDPYVDLGSEFWTFLGILAWIGVGIWIAHSTRESGCLGKALVAFLFTKGFFIYWLLYVVFSAINVFISLTIRLIAWLVERKNILSLVCIAILSVVHTLI